MEYSAVKSGVGEFLELQQCGYNTLINLKR